jgi:hydrogenase maturation protein HypF
VPSRSPPSPGSSRLQIQLRGLVQGVGFRPFVFRLASELALNGWVNNSPQGVRIEVEGAPARLRDFLLRLETEKPPLSSIQSLESRWLDPIGYAGFEVRPSSTEGEKTALVMPDIATCADCRREIFDPSDRRFRYPFTNCTHCGPRFSIIQALPYDRARTSMQGFIMCRRCQAEYDDPQDRRFHAQPNACPECGPQLELWAPSAALLAQRDQALLTAAEAIRQGRIVAVKGLGGFHLILAAGEAETVRRLRERKRREEKPFAIMAPSLEQVKTFCQADGLEERLLRSPESPIVLLRRRADASGAKPLVSEEVAPGNPYLGVMLPYTPLHHLLLAELGFPVVATSGNLSDEPICIDPHEALSRLGGLADLFLVHNRPIVRQVDDSVARILLGRELLLRRSRGYAPLPIRLDRMGREPRSDGVEVSSAVSTQVPAEPGAQLAEPRTGQEIESILAVGAHLKSTIALAVGPQVFLSQHIGDLENAPALEAFRRVIEDLQRLYGVRVARVAADLHPDYLSTKFARAAGLPLTGVQHHYAHALACLAENELAPPALSVSWDGTGYGPDGTIWGGEFLRITRDSFERFAHLRTFRLPGGERAVKEPRRVALGLLYEMWGEDAFAQATLPPIRAFQPRELALLRQSLSKGINAPETSSMGRLFDAIASLINLRQVMRFEGQAAMELEFALEGIATDEFYPMPITNDGNEGSGLVLDWSALTQAVLAEAAAGTPPGVISARFHNSLAEAIVEVTRRAGEPCVLLTGGCFQNQYLAARSVQRLQDAGFRPYWHQRVPPNDGGVALGQIVAASRRAALET